MSMQTQLTSPKYTLNRLDWLKALLIAVISPVFTIIMSSLNAGSLTFDWKSIGIVAIGAAMSYILKNFLSPAQIIVTEPTDKQIEAVKDGETNVSITSKNE